MTEAMWYEDEEREVGDPGVHGFEVDSDQKAMWCIRKIQQAEKEIEAYKNHYEQQLEQMRRKLEDTRAFFNEAITRYMVGGGLPLHETKTAFSYSLPGVKLKLTKPSVVLQHDDEKLLADLQGKGERDYIKVKESVDWAKVKKHVQDTGELFDGIWSEEKPGELKIEFKEDK